MGTVGVIRRKATLPANVRWTYPRTPAVVASRERELAEVLPAISSVVHEECFTRIEDAIEAP
jgi:hypothetical protein